MDAAREAVRIERGWNTGAAAGIAGDRGLADYWGDFADEYRRGEAVAVADVERNPRTAARAEAYAAIGARGP